MFDHPAVDELCWTAIMLTIYLPILSCSSPGHCPELPGGRGRGLCVRLPSGDAQPIAGPAESRQYPVWRPLLAGPPPLPQAAGPQHNAEPLQRQRHAAAVPFLGPPVQPGPPGEQRHRAACLRPLGALRTIQAYWWVFALFALLFNGKMPHSVLICRALVFFHKLSSWPLEV